MAKTQTYEDFAPVAPVATYEEFAPVAVAEPPAGAPQPGPLSGPEYDYLEPDLESPSMAAAGAVATPFHAGAIPDLEGLDAMARAEARYQGENIYEQQKQRKAEMPRPETVGYEKFTWAGERIPAQKGEEGAYPLSELPPMGGPARPRIAPTDVPDPAEWAKLGEIGLRERLSRWTHIDTMKLLPLSFEQLQEAAFVYGSAKNLQANEADVRANPGKYDYDLTTVENYMLAELERQSRGTTMGTDIFQGVAAMVPWMLEFMATGGVASALRSGLRRTAIKLLGQQARRKAARLITRGVAWGLVGAMRAAISQHRVLAGTFERMQGDMEFTPDGHFILMESQYSPAKAYALAFGDAVIEAMSEEAGAAITGVGPKAARALMRRFPAVKKALQPFAARLKRLAVTDDAAKAAWRRWSKSGFSRAGYSNFIGELSEEQLGRLMKATYPGLELGQEADSTYFERLTQSVPTWRQFMVEAGVLAVPGTVRAAVGRLAGEIDAQGRKRAGRHLIRLAEGAGYAPTEAEMHALRRGNKDALEAVFAKVLEQAELEEPVGPQVEAMPLEAFETPTEAEAGEIMQERAASMAAAREAAPEAIPAEKVAPEPAEAPERPAAEEVRPRVPAVRRPAGEAPAAKPVEAQPAPTEGVVRPEMPPTEAKPEVTPAVEPEVTPTPPQPAPAAEAEKPAPERAGEGERGPTRRKRAARETEAAKKRTLAGRRKAGRERNKLLREIRDFYLSEGLYDLEPPQTGPGQEGEFGDEITEGSFDFDANFGGKIPGELRDHFPRGRIPAKYRKFIKENVLAGLGEEVLQRMGAEAFIARLDELAGGKKGEAEREVAAAERWARDTGNTAMLSTIERYHALKGADTVEAPSAATQKRERIISEKAYQAALDHFSETRLHGGLLPFSGAEVKHAGVYILYHIENGVTRLREITKAAIQDWKKRYSERETRRLIRQAWRKTAAARNRIQEIGRAERQAERRGRRRVRKADIRAMVEGVEEPVTMTPSRLLAYAMKKAQTTATLVERQTAKDIIRTHKTLVRYAQSLGLPKGEIGKVAMAVASAKTIKQQTKVALAIEQLAEHYKHREAVADYKKQLKRLQKKYGKDFARMFPNFRDLARELTAPIDPSKPMAKTARRLEGTLQYLDDHPEVRDEMPDHVFKALQRLDQVPLAEMTADEIGAATNGLRMVLKLNELKKTLKRKKQSRPLAEAKAEVLTNVGKPEVSAEGKQVVAERGRAKRLIDYVAGNIRLFCYAIDNADESGPMSTYLDGSLAEADGANIERQETHLDALVAILEKHGLKRGVALRLLSAKLGGRTRMVRTELPNGTVVVMTPARRVGFYLTAQQPEGRAALKSERGWIVDEVTRGKLRRWRTHEKQAKVALQLTEADIEALEQDLTPIERRLAAALHEYLTVYLAKHLNVASVELYDYEKATNPDYFPLHRFAQDVGKEIKLERRPFAPPSVESWSALKPRTGGTARLVIPDALEVAVSHAYHVAALESYGPAGRNVNALLADPDIADAVDAKYGAGATTRIKVLVRRIYGQAMEADPGARMWARLRGNTAGAILTLRLSTMIKQALSLPLAANELGWRHMLPYMGRPMTPGETRIVRQITNLDASPTLWSRREKGKFGREIGDFIALREMDRVYTGKTSVRQMQGYGLRGGDSYAIDRIILAARHRAKAELGKGASEAEIKRRTVELAESAVRWTQPTWNMQDRTMLGGTANELLKGVTMFRSFLDKALIQGNKAVIEYRNSDHGTRATARCLAKLATLAVVLSVLPYIVGRLTRKLYGRLRPEDEDPEAYRVGLDLLQESAGIVPGGRNIVYGIRGAAEGGAVGAVDAIDIPHIETVNDLGRGTVELVRVGVQAGKDAKYETGLRKGEPKWQRTALRGAERLTSAGGRVFGYSTENIWDIRQAVSGGREYPRSAHYEALARAAKRKRTATVKRWLEQLHKDGAAWSNINTSLKGRGVGIEARRAALAQWRDIVKK